VKLYDNERGVSMYKKIIPIIIILSIFIFTFPVMADNREVLLMKIKGPIGPVTSHYFERVLRQGKIQNALCIIIQMDTPGGLMDSMKDIMQNIISSEVPIIVYVSPGGASATSAGVFITLSAHIAAMAPNTNIGAAHPVMIGQGGEQKMSDEMKEKITNDAVALIKTTAEKKGRNMEWAEKAVRESVSATEKEALELKAVDLIANDINDLLSKINGMTVNTVKGDIILNTSGATVRDIPMNGSEKFFNILSNPNVAYILIILGIYGLIYELASPMSILPGVVGGICIILSLFSLGTLPVNYAGLALIVFSFFLFIVDIKAPTHGILTAGGVISMVLGSLFLFNSDLPYYRISPLLIVSVAILTSLFFMVIIGAIVSTFRKKVTTGKEGLMEKTGVVTFPLEPKGQIMLDGAIWNAITTGRYVRKDEDVIVKKIEGLKVFVEPVEKNMTS
jgi:membrane-bound serine protease (ClpP class)